MARQGPQDQLYRVMSSTQCLLMATAGDGGNKGIQETKGYLDSRVSCTEIQIDSYL